MVVMRGQNGAQERSPGFISKQGQRGKGQILLFHRVILGCAIQLPVFTYSSQQQNTRPLLQGSLPETCELMAHLTHLPLVQWPLIKHIPGTGLELSVHSLGAEKMQNKQWYPTHCGQERSWSFFLCLLGRAGSDCELMKRHENSGQVPVSQQYHPEIQARWIGK